MEFHGVSLEPYRIPWSSHGNELGFHGIPYNSIEVHGFPGNSMKFHGIPWGYFTRTLKGPSLLKLYSQGEVKKDIGKEPGRLKCAVG